MPSLAFEYKPAPVSSRVAPAPTASGISFRTNDLPRVSHRQIAATCDHFLTKCRGDYAAPASRWLFELCHEVKALLAPLFAEEQTTRARLQHLESLLYQWNEVFGAPRDDDLVSPAALAKALKEQKAANERLRADAEAASFAAIATERRCLEALAQHHRAHAQERERIAEQHAAELQRLHAMHEAQLAEVASATGASLVM